MMFQKRGKIAFTVLNSVVLVIVSFLVVYGIWLAVDLKTLPDVPPDAEWNESLGVNLSRGILTIFIILDAVVTAVLSAIGEIFSVVLIRKTDGKPRVYGIITAVIYAVYAVLAVLCLFVLL